MRGFTWLERLFNELYTIIMIVSKVNERSFLKKEHVIKKPHLSQREDRSLKRISRFKFDM